MTMMLSSEVEIDLSPIVSKMQAEGETLDGEPIDFDVAARDYLRFLTLHLRYPDRTLVPSALIDKVWHYHILDTRKYASDCNRVFGDFLHHDPYFGIGGVESELANLAAWNETKSLWEQEFDEPLIGSAHRCSNKDCR